MALHPFTASNFDTQHFRLFGCSTAIVHDDTIELQLINELGQELYCQKEKTMEKFSSIQHSLL